MITTMKEFLNGNSMCVSDSPTGAIIEGYPNPLSFTQCEEIVKRASDYEELKKALRWALGTVDNCTDIMEEDDDGETEEVREIISQYRKQFDLKKKTTL